MGREHRVSNSQGFVSIIVTIIIIVLVTLIAVSFAFLSRQNQNQSLNSQLSTQAFYAAESGVNQAIKLLKSTGTSDITTCDSGLTRDAGATLNAQANIKYTCVLVSNQPVDLRYDSISTDGSTIVHVRTDSNVNDLVISWQDNSGSTASGTSTFADSSSNFYLPQTAFTNNYTGSDSAFNRQTAEFPLHTGILRATIIPTSAATSYTNLLNNSQTVFLYPRASGLPANSLGTVAYTPGGVAFGDGSCNVASTPDFCNTKITGVGTNDFYLRLKAVYKNVAVTIRAFNGPSPTASNVGGSQPLIGTQAVIDATGRAGDTVRRIQVRVPLQEGYIFPEFALESADTICKIYSGYPGSVSYLNPPANLYSGLSADINNKTADQLACKLPNTTAPNF